VSKILAVPNRPRYRGARLAPRLFGPVGIGVLVVAAAALWIVQRPSDQPIVRFTGELIGVESVLLLSVGLVLASALNMVERWFEGVDRAAVWHRGIAIAAVLLLVVHSQVTKLTPAEEGSLPILGLIFAEIALIGLVVFMVWAIAPRWKSFVPKAFQPLIFKASETKIAKKVRTRFSGYSIWRSFHRFTGLVVAIGFAHGLIDSTIFESPLLRWVYIAIGGVGLLFYAYRELIARRLAYTNDYVVEEVDPVDSLTTEITLKPLDHKFAYKAGQFTIVYLEAKDGWHRHPFSIASAPSEANVRFTIKSLGDFTKNVANLVEVGMPAVISKARGHFDYRRGTEHQAWIAGGVGIAPILSWLRAATADTLPRQVDLFYSVRGPAAYGDELRELASHLDAVTIHIIDSETQPHLTSQQVIEAANCPPPQMSAFICGPSGMVDVFQKELHKAKVRQANINREYFTWR
jgi:predicted ferric reductase